MEFRRKTLNDVSKSVENENELDWAGQSWIQMDGNGIKQFSN